MLERDVFAIVDLPLQFSLDNWHPWSFHAIKFSFFWISPRWDSLYFAFIICLQGEFGSSWYLQSHLQAIAKLVIFSFVKPMSPLFFWAITRSHLTKWELWPSLFDFHRKSLHNFKIELYIAIEALKHDSWELVSGETS